MTAPTPQILSATLWNRLLDLHDEDKGELDRITWQLRKLVKDKPADFDARVALALAFLLGGNRVEGIEHINAARGLWLSSNGKSIYDFMWLLLDVGELNVAKDFLERFLSQKNNSQDNNIRNIAYAYGIRSGDLDWINQGIRETGIDDQVAKSFVEELQRKELLSAFQAHQDLIESIVNSFSCTFNYAINLDEFGQPVVLVRYHTTLSGKERLYLYRRIADLKVDQDVVNVSSFISLGILGPQIQDP